MDGKRNSLRTAKDLLDRLKGKFREYISAYVPERSDGEKQDERNRIRAGAVFLVKGIAVLLLTALMSRCTTLMGSRTLGMALFYSLGRLSLFSFVGMAIGAVWSGIYSAPMLLLSAVAVGVRIVYGRLTSEDRSKPILFNEPTLIRVFMAAGTAAVSGMIAIVGGGFLYYDVFGTLFGVAITPLLCFLFGCVTRREEARYMLLTETGAAAVCAATVFALRDLSVIGFSLATVLAFGLSLYISKEGGILRGGVYGLLCGIACSPAYAPIFGLAGIAAGMFWRVSAYVAISAAAITGVAFGVYLDGFTAIRTFAPDVLASSAVFMLLNVMRLLPPVRIFPKVSEAGEVTVTENILSERRRKGTLIKLDAVSDALCSLSEVFWNISDKLRKPGIYEVRSAVTDAFETRCVTCAMCELCQQRDYTETLGVYNQLSRAAYKNGVVSRKDLPDYMLTRCHDIDRIIAQINLDYAGLLEKTHKSDKTEIFAADYEAMAKLIDDAGDDSDDYVLNEELTAHVRSAAGCLDFAANSISVYGSRKLTVLAGGVDLSRVRMTAGELKRAFENLCGVSLTDPQFSLDSDYVTMTMESRREYAAVTAVASDRKNDEAVNGDSSSSFENGDGVYYTLISDGMGSGREAALTSRICGVFCEKLLSAGMDKAVTLEMLNNFIRSKSTECFATLDLLEIDMLSGKAGFIKSGAAPSYIMRGGDLFKVASNTMPVGITRCINAEEIKFELEAGDVVVMVSDGVTGSLEEGTWLIEQLTSDWTDDLEDMAERILKAAKANNARSDDMTVTLTRLSERAG